MPFPIFFMISLAPMLDVTTTQYRKMIRLISCKTLLFTEMIVDNTILHLTDAQLIHRLDYPNDYTVIQIGGSNVSTLVDAAKKLKNLGYSKINLNCGCPSSKVQKGCFGAVLMLNVPLVIEIINGIYTNTGIVPSIKCRIGVDKNDSYEFFRNFIYEIVNHTECREFYVHSRKCILNGLNPSGNRKIPVLNYDFCYKIKSELPNVKIILNGGVDNHKIAKKVLNNLDGLMIGRKSIQDPFIFYYMEKTLENVDLDEKYIFEYRKETLLKYLELFGEDYVLKNSDVMPIMNFFNNHHRNRKYKQLLNDVVTKKKDLAYLKRELGVLMLSIQCIEKTTRDVEQICVLKEKINTV